MTINYGTPEQQRGLQTQFPGNVGPPMETIANRFSPGADAPADQPGIMSYLQKAGRAVKKHTQQPGFWDRAALGLNSMRLEPDQNLAAGLRERMSDRRSLAATQGSSNRSIDMLRNMRDENGQPVPAAMETAAAIEANPSMAGALLNSFFQMRQSGKMGLANRDYPNGLSVVTTKNGDKKYILNGVQLTDPTKIDAAMQDVMRFEAEAAGANRAAVISQDISQDIFGKMGIARQGLITTDRAIRAIDAGGITGWLENYLPNITEASAELRNSLDMMGLSVIQSVAFGALSEKEMETAMNIGAPRALSGPLLRQWLVDKKDAQAKALDALTKAAQYLSKPGNTINTFLEEQASANGPDGRRVTNIFAEMSPTDISTYMNENLADMTTGQKEQATARLLILGGDG